MAYIQNSDIGTRVGGQSLIQLADDDGDNLADAAVLDEVRLAAEGEVNSHLATRFAVPIDTIIHPELAGLLASLTLDLAEYRLRQRRPPVSMECERKRTHTLDLLRRFSNGELALPSSAQVESSSLRGSLASTTGDDRVLSREELRDY